MNKLSEAEASLVKRGRSAQRPLAGRPERRSGGEAPALLWAFGPLKAVWLRHENQARCSGGCRCGGGAEEKAAVLSQMSSVPEKAVSTSQVQTHQECVAAFPAQCPAWCAPGGRAGRCPHPAAGRETWNDVMGREQVVPTSQDPDASPEARAPCPGGQRAVLTSGVSRARTRLTRWQGLRGTGERGGPAAAPASRPTCSGSGAGCPGRWPSRAVSSAREPWREHRVLPAPPLLVDRGWRNAHRQLCSGRLQEEWPPAGPGPRSAEGLGTPTTFL